MFSIRNATAIFVPAIATLIFTLCAHAEPDQIPSTPQSPIQLEFEALKQDVKGLVSLPVKSSLPTASDLGLYQADDTESILGKIKKQKSISNHEIQLSPLKIHADAPKTMDGADLHPLLKKAFSQADEVPGYLGRNNSPHEAAMKRIASKEMHKWLGSFGSIASILALGYQVYSDRESTPQPDINVYNIEHDALDFSYLEITNHPENENSSPVEVECSMQDVGSNAEACDEDDSGSKDD